MSSGANNQEAMHMKKLLLKKCFSCPYHIGTIKCVKSPCPECLASKSKKHPFVEPEIKNEKNILNKDEKGCGNIE